MSLAMNVFCHLLVWAAIFAASLRPVLAEDTLPFPEPTDTSVLPRSALLETTQGPIEIILFREDAPISVKNFEYLVKKGLYDGVKFHRYEADFAIESGDPTGTGRGGPGYTVPPQISQRKHYRGAVGCARLSDKVNPERRCHGSQFFIMLSPQPKLDGYNTIFGQVVNGLENLDKLRLGDKILAIRFPRAAAPR